MNKQAQNSSAHSRWCSSAAARRSSAAWDRPDRIDVFGIACAFGLAIVAMAYGIGPVSGCHVNPAVSFGVFVAGRMSAAEMISYWIAQVLGAIVGAAVLYLILSGKASGWTGGLGQNGWGAGYLGEYSMLSAFVFEVVGDVPVPRLHSRRDPGRRARASWPASPSA